MDRTGDPPPSKLAEEVDRGRYSARRPFANSAPLPPILASLRKSAKLRRPVWLAAISVVPLLAAGALLAARESERSAFIQQQASFTALRELRARLVAPALSEEAPFPERLPISQSSTRVISHLREASMAQAVSVLSISSSQQTATANTLGKLSLDISLRGGYGEIKRLLADLLTRDSQQVVVQQLSMRRAKESAASATAAPNGGNDLEVRLLATWLSRPVAGPSHAKGSDAAGTPSSNESNR